MSDARIGIVVDPRGAVTGARTVRRSLDDISGGAKGALSAVQMLTGALAGLGVGFGLRQAVRDFAAFEQGLIGVGKVTDITGRQLKELGRDIQMIGRAVPVATEQLLDIAQAAGQLGVTGSKNITVFTETVARLGLASNLAGSDAATSLARILTVTGTAVGEVDRLGSTIVQLGNNFAATEREIAAAATRVAQATAQFGTLPAEVASIGAALAAVGVEAEAGGSQIGIAFQAINDALRQGGEEMVALQRITGQTREELSRAFFGGEATKVFEDFVAGLGRIRAEGGDVASAMADLGVQGIRASAVFGTLASRYEVLARALQLGRQEWQDNQALIKESDTAAEAFSAQMQFLQNAIKDVSIEIGAALAPEIQQLTKSFKEFAIEARDSGDIARWAATMGEGMRLAASAVMLLANNFEILIAAGALYLGRALGPMIQENARAITQWGQLQVAQSQVARSSAEAAQATLATERASRAAAAAREAELAANLRNIQNTRQLIAAETELENKRLAAQISQQGRIESVRRLADLRQSHAAMLRLEATETAALRAAMNDTIAAGARQAAAMEASAAATAKATAAARAATAAMAGLNRVMAFFGGPVGFALTAIVGSMALLSTRTNEANAHIREAARLTEQLRAGFEDAANEAEQLAGQTAAIAEIRALEMQRRLAEVLASEIREINRDLDYFHKELERVGQTGEAVEAFRALSNQFRTGAIDVVDFRDELAKLGLEHPELQPIVEEIIRVSQTAVDTKVQIDELAASLRALKGSFGQGLGNAVTAGIETIKSAIGEVNRALANAGAGGGTSSSSGRDIAAEWREQRDRLQETNEALQDIVAAYGQSEQAVAKAQKALELLTATQGISKDFSEEQRAALVALMRDQQDYASQIEDLQRIQDLDGQLELLQAELQLVGETKAVREEALAVLEAEIRLKQRGVDLSSQQAREELKRVRQMAQTRQAIDEQTRALAEQERAFQSLVDDSVRYGSDLFADLFRDTSGGWRGMWENMRQTMISMLARMAAEAALRPIVVSVLGAMGVAGAGAAAGAAGIGGAGGGGMFGLGNLSDLSSIFNASGGSMMPGVDAWAQANLGFGSIGEMARPTAGFIGPMPAQTAGLLNGGSAMAGFASLGNVLGIAGSALPGLMSGNYAQAGLGTAGAAIGTALLPGIGTAVGGFLGNAVGSLFGGGGNTDQQIRPYSHALGTGKGVETPFREFRNSAHRFDGGPLQNAIVEADKAIAAALSDRAIEQVRDYFDLAGTIKGTKRDNKELGPKHFARFIRDSFTDMMEALGGTAAREGFGRMASGLGNDPDAVLALAQQAATFLGNLADNRLFKPQEISQLEAAWDALNEQGEEFKRLAAELGQPVEEVMRQLREAQQAFRDEIQQGYQDQIDGILRPAELAWRQLREAQVKEIEELEKIGASTARAQQLHQLQIRALFEQNYELQRQYLEGMIDLGEDLNAQVGALWGIVSSGIGRLAQDSNSAYQEAVRLGRQYSQINRNLQQTIAGLRTGPQSPLSLEQQLMEALDRFRQTLGEALGGDSEAAQQLQQLVNPVLDLASQFFGRTEGYAQIFDEVLRGLEMAGVAMETQAGGFAALASALDAQLLILGEINDVLNQRDELGEDFESRYNKLTSELEDVGYTIGGINAFLRDAADAIPTLIVTSFASGLDSAQLAKRMGELFQATVTATEQAMRDGVEDIGAAIDGAQQALLRGWIPDFIELAEQFNGAIPEIRFDRVTARAVAHYEASADQLGEGLERAVAQVQFDGLQQAIYTAQELVGTRFDAAVGGISFEGIDGEYLSSVLYDGITGIAQAAQVTLIGQAERIEGVIDSTLEAFTLDAARATILDSVDIINNGATSVQLAFGRVEGALLRLSNNADGHIIAMIDEVDTAIARFVNWGQGSLRVGVESLRAGLLDVRNAGTGVLELWADTVEARETRISNLGPGALAARIDSLRGQLVNVRNSGAGLLEFWANRVAAGETRIENIDRGDLRAIVNDLRAGILTIRNRAAGHLEFWAETLKAQETHIENLNAGNLVARINDLRAGLLDVRNAGEGALLLFADTVESREARIANLGPGHLRASVESLRSGLVTIRNAGEGALEFWAETVAAQETRIANIGAGTLLVNIDRLETNLLNIRNAGQGRLLFWANRIDAQLADIRNLDIGELVANIKQLRTNVLRIRNAGQGRLAVWGDRVEAQRTSITNLDAGNLIVNIRNLRSSLLTIRNTGQGLLEFWADTVESRATVIENIDRGNIRAVINDLRGGIVMVRNLSRGHLQFWANRVKADTVRIENIDRGDLRAIVNDLRAGILTIRNHAAGHLEFWADRVEAGETRIENVGRGDLMAFVTTLRSGLVSVRNLGAGHLQFWANRVKAGETRIENINRGNLDATIGTLRSALVTIRNLGSGRLEFWAETIKAQEARIENLNAGTLVARINNLRSDLLTIRNAGQGALELWADTVESREARISNLDAGTLIARIQDLRAELLTIRNAGQGRLLFWADTVEAREASILNIGGGALTTAANSFRAELLTIRNLGQGRLDFWTGRLEARESAISGLDQGNLVANANDFRARLLAVRNAGQGRIAFWRDRVEARLQPIKDLDIGNIVTNINSLRSSLVSTRNTAQQRLNQWQAAVQKGLDRIANLSNDLGGGAIAAELKKIVENRLPKRFGEAIDRAFENVFGTVKPTEFFKNMDKLVGANSSLVTSLRELSRTMLLLARKDQIDAFAASIGARADKAMRVPSLEGARGKLNADQGWENQGHSYARINYSASKGFTMGSTHKSGGSGSSQLNKMKTRAQELMDQLNHLVSVNRIAIDPSKLPSKMELNSRKGKASAQQIFDDLMQRGAVVARVDDPKDNMLKRMADEMRRLVGGTLPKYGANYRVKNGKLEMDLWAGDRSLTRTGAQLTNLTDIAGQFLQMLKHEIKVNSQIEPLLKAIDFRPAGLGPQGGLEQLARVLAENGLGTSNVPKFASGGYHDGGLAIVGERGPELVDFATPLRIYSAPDTSRIMAGFANDNGSFRELIAEVRALRAENAELRRTVSEGFGDTVQAEGVSGTAIRAEIRGLREDVEELQTATRQQQRRASA